MGHTIADARNAFVNQIASNTIDKPVERGGSRSGVYVVQRMSGLSKPAQLTFFEKIKAFFGWSDKSTIHAEKMKHQATDLVFKICMSSPEAEAEAEWINDPHQTIMESFVALRDMAKDKYRDQFKFDFSTVKAPDGRGHESSFINYTVSVGDTELTSITFNATDRGNVLAFQQALINTGIEPSELGTLPHSVEHADAMLVRELEKALPKIPLHHAPPSMASLAAQLDEVNGRPAFAGRPHAAIGEKVRILSNAFPGQQFSIDFPNDRHGYEINVRTPGAPGEIALQQAVLGTDASEQAQFPALLSSAVKQTVTNLMTEYGESLGDLASFTEGNAQTMCDDLADREKLMAELKNPDYSSATFTGITLNADDRTFTAMFGDKSMVFSNRMGSVELRGVALRERLQAPFENLEVILTESHGTAQDAMLRYVLNPPRQIYFGQIDMHNQERAAVHREIGEWVVGKTTLRELWDLTPPEQLSSSNNEMPENFLPPAPSPSVNNVADGHGHYIDPNTIA